MRIFPRIRRAICACPPAVFLLIFAAALAAGMAAIWPQAGDEISSKGSLSIDASHAGQGYIMAMAEPTQKKLKLRIEKDDVIYTYDLNGSGEYEIFPLQMGSGKYKCVLYKNVSANKYAKNAEISIRAELENEYTPFLCPSQYVNYTQDSPAVAKAAELCAGLAGDADKLEAIRTFMAEGFVYDYVRALTASQAYLGDVDGCFESRMGLCQDLAAVAACMLRSQGVPTQLVIGYAGDIYHAWNNVLIDGEYVRLDITAELNGISKGLEYTAERIY